MSPVPKNITGFKFTGGEVAVITFNQPRANVLSSEVLKDLVKTITALLHRNPKALLITGEGKTFVAGADIKEMSEFGQGQSEAKAYARLFHHAMNSIADFPWPVVAAVNGFALGGGCELTLACDIVLAADNAVFAQPEINLGIIPGAGGTQRLPKRVGSLIAKELILTGRNVNAKEAMNIGLINKVVPEEKLFEEAMGLCKLIASKPVQCIEAIKTLIDSGSMEDEIEAFGSLFTYEERRELMENFLKKK